MNPGRNTLSFTRWPSPCYSASQGPASKSTTTRDAYVHCRGYGSDRRLHSGARTHPWLSLGSHFPSRRLGDAHRGVIFEIERSPQPTLGAFRSPDSAVWWYGTTKPARMLLACPIATGEVVERTLAWSAGAPMATGQLRRRLVQGLACSTSRRGQRPTKAERQPGHPDQRQQRNRLIQRCDVQPGWQADGQDAEQNRQRGPHPA